MVSWSTHDAVDWFHFINSTGSMHFRLAVQRSNARAMNFHTLFFQCAFHTDTVLLSFLPSYSSTNHELFCIGLLHAICLFIRSSYTNCNAIFLSAFLVFLKISFEETIASVPLFTWNFSLRGKYCKKNLLFSIHIVYLHHCKHAIHINVTTIKN